VLDELLTVPLKFGEVAKIGSEAMSPVRKWFLWAVVALRCEGDELPIDFFSTVKEVHIKSRGGN
jgi:transcription initiation factor IIF auxiliary subunit